MDLIEYVNKKINEGKTVIVIPKELLSESSDEEIEEAERLCILNGCKIEVG